MKNRPIKEWLFFAFIALGIACSLILPLTIMTYLDYAGSGYGLEAEVDSYSIGLKDRVLVEITLTNPGKIEMQVTGIQMSFTGPGEWVNGTVPGEIYDIGSKGIEVIMFTFPIQSQTASDSLLSGQAEYELSIEIYIPHRDAYTTLVTTGSMEVV